MILWALSLVRNGSPEAGWVLQILMMPSGGILVCGRQMSCLKVQYLSLRYVRANRDFTNSSSIENDTGHILVIRRQKIERAVFSGKCW